MSADKPAPARKRHLVDIDPELFRRIGVIAGWRGGSISDWINNALAPLVGPAFAEVVEEMRKDVTARPPKKP